MTTPESVDVRRLAIKADGDHYFVDAHNCVCGWRDSSGMDWLLHKLDAVLAAVTPVIRRQVAEEIAGVIDEQEQLTRRSFLGGREADALRTAAAIARSHSTQPTEEETTGGHDQ